MEYINILIAFLLGYLAARSKFNKDIEAFIKRKLGKKDE